MKGCCPPPGCEVFTEKLARRDAARYRRRGLGKVSRRLVELVGGSGSVLLEVGGGVGALQIELLRGGRAVRAVNVELSPAYELEAASLLADAGIDDVRIERHILDFAGEGDRIPPADAVVMNRVVCCYPDMPALVAAASEHARRVLALSYPPDTFVFRLGARAINLWCCMLRREFRFFIHKPEAMFEVAAKRGLRLAARERVAMWELAALERA